MADTYSGASDTDIANAVLGLGQAAVGLLGSLEKPPYVRPKPVPRELYESKNLVKGIYSEILAEKTQRESSARDLAAQRRTINASSGYGAVGQMQADIASNVQSGVESAEIYGNYRKAYMDVIQQEMAANSQIAGAKISIEDQRMNMQKIETDMYIARQEAYGQLMQAGIENTMGSLQSSENDKLMKETYGLDQSNADKIASDYNQVQSSLSDTDKALYQQAMVNKDYTTAGNIVNRNKRYYGSTGGF